MVYHEISGVTWFFLVYTWAFRQVCIKRKIKSQIGYCMVIKHEKACHNYFIPCLYNFGTTEDLQKISSNFRTMFGYCYNAVWNFVINFLIFLKVCDRLQKVCPRYSRAFTVRIHGILQNMQLLSTLLIGCIVYAMGQMHGQE